ncbi:sensor histidine kinase [Streptomyces tateyamensis]|uniref:Sensor histidine kinase n=2 Tax=Streptomyces tateyamensis TaxID=565073 RepID=A0A2V4P2N5_9ACTN|nr:sensor histidine kinase [Streptomyces tateyamensis]
MSVELPLWRAISVFRVLALAYSLARYAGSFHRFLHPVAGWIYLGALVLWTLATMRAFGDPRRLKWPVLAVDLVVGLTGIALSGAYDSPARVAAGSLTLPGIWVCGTVLGCAGKGGWKPATAAVLLLAGSNVLWHGGLDGDNLHDAVLLLLVGGAIGYVMDVARAGEATLTEALRVEAATRERERLSRDIHDGVLQVLALVQRQDEGELSRLAGEQERALRVLMAGAVLPRQAQGGARDLRELLGPYQAERVTLAGPASPVLLPVPVAGEVAAAVGAALDNVARHAGPTARAWILLEEEPDTVTVSVRDDGPGYPPGRLAEARAAGRLGVSQSIEGRMRDLGGTAVLHSLPGEGVEVELRVPRERT